MAHEYRSFVQFHHPGSEHELDSGARWNTYDNDHRRKFMQFPGRWRNGSASGDGELWAWGEWEAQSDRLHDFDHADDARLPDRLWRPYYRPMPGYIRLHNTDPFIFGDQFLYSNCKQTGALKRLGRGSVLAFGSHFRGEWVLDTVFVVACAVEYQSTDPRKALSGRAPEAFLEVTGGPLVANDKPRTRKLYYGATPNDPVDDMFSFFPAMPAGGDSGFKRPRISLPSEYFDEDQIRGEFGRWSDFSSDTLRELWNSLVEQVRACGMVLGTHAELPERRDE